MLDEDQPLTDDEVAQFWRDGYLLLRGVLSREEAEHYRQLILGLLPRDLSIPEHWGAIKGRIKPYATPGNHTFDGPDFIPLFCNERLYRVMRQLLESPALRVLDGSVGISMRDDSVTESERSQHLHLDASVPTTVDNFDFTLAETQLGGCYYFTDVEPRGGGIHVVPGGPRLVQEQASADPQGRHLHREWKDITGMTSVEVTGSAGDFALLHHLMPHGASYNRLPTARVAQFLRYVREDQTHGAGARPAPGTYNDQQIAAMGPLGRKLFGVDAW